MILRHFSLPLALLLSGLLTPVLLHAQTVLVELDFDAGKYNQTGTAGTTFSAYEGTVTFAAGVGGGQAAVFNGATSLRASGSPVTTALTISFWMKTTTDNGLSGSAWYQGAGLVDGELGGVTADWGISQLGTKLAFGIGATDHTIFSTSSVNTGAWIHVAATWDNSGIMSLYLDGTEESSYATASTASRRTDNEFFIGRDLGGNRYTGTLDEIRIYDSALSGGQIATLGAVPEPSTYAAIFGALVLGLAVWRKRRCRRQS